MTPIIKNIFVIDEQGNKYEATYPKRAKGLVKDGRARFISENTICLTCPPNNILEDNIMNENINKVDDKNKPLELTMDYVLSRVDYIMKDNSYIHEAIEAVRNMNVNEGPSGEGSESVRSEAILKVVQSREITNQQLINLYEKMYDDLKPKKEGLKDKALQMLEGVNSNSALTADVIISALGTIRHIDE